MSHMTSVWTARIVILGVHAGCLLALWTGVSPAAVVVCIVSYLIRIFAVTAGYHRLFAHRSFNATRYFRSFLGIVGCTALQGGPLKWAKRHRHHHVYSDRPQDVHSPRQKGFWSAHIGWMFDSEPEVLSTNVDDLQRKFPELTGIERRQPFFIAAFVFGLFLLGEILGASYGTSGAQMVVWGFIISTTFTWHVTWSVNSINHTWGSRRFETTGTDCNNFLLGLITLGEGHHNNHHHMPGLVRQGLLWWEIDVTYYVLKILSWLRVTWDLNEPTPEVCKAARSLGRIRATLRKRKLDSAVITERVRTSQGLLADAVRTMARLRSRLNKLLRGKEIDKAEMRDRLRSGCASFSDRMKHAELLAAA